MIFYPPIFLTQTPQDVKDIISTNDATIQGILLAVIIALGTALIYIYKEKNAERIKLLAENNKLRDDQIKFFQEYTTQLIKVNENYNEAINILRREK